jgi:hypothetical protein
MTFNSVNSFFEKLQSNVVADQVREPSASERPILNQLNHNITNAINNGLDQNDVLKTTMLILLLINKGYSPDLIEPKKEFLYNYTRLHPIELTDEYIDNIGQILYNM